MFDGDYTINGQHATYVKYLVNEAKAFKRYIDVYMTGAVIGALNNKRSKKIDTHDRARIYADAFNTEYVKCNEIFKIVILSDTSKNWTTDERINICFKYRDKMDENAIPPILQSEVDIMKDALKLFNEYAFGGIEILYENFSSSAAVNINDTVDYAYKSIYDQYMLIETGKDNVDLENLFKPEY